jgi:phosphoenolpyruvate synthase/pyruvate phosphate dikinase
MVRYVIDLRSRAALRPALTGGKGAALAWLNRQACNVPPGFVVSTSAYQSVLVEIPPEKRKEAAALREALKTNDLPPRVSAAILKAYRRLSGPVAVRSSLVGEDAKAASFAGQFDTYLNVEGEKHLLEAVRACWASVHGSRAADYLDRRIAEGARPPMAVVVQQMVRARCAGVAFSIDPVTGENSVVIEAARGLGEHVVGGKVAADRFVVDARGSLAESLPATPGAPVLAEDLVLELARIVRRLDQRTHGQDVEWAWDGEKLYLLQCRPITRPASQRLYSRRLVADMTPGIIKPMVYHTNTAAKAQEVFGRIFTELIGPNQVPPEVAEGAASSTSLAGGYERLVRCIYSRVYADMTLFGELLEKVGLPANVMEMMLRDEQSDHRQKMKVTPRTVLALARFGRLALRHGRMPRNCAASVAAFEARLDPYQERDWSEVPLPELLVAIDNLLRLRNEDYFPFFVSVIRMSVRNQILLRWVEKHVRDAETSELTIGLAGLKGIEPSREIRMLGKRARTIDPALCQLFLEAELPDIYAELQATSAGCELKTNVDTFLRRFGFLSSNSADYTTTTWGEDPLLIWRSIGRAGGRKDSAPSRDAVQVRENAQRRIRAQLGPLTRLAFDHVLRMTAAAIEDREAHSLLLSRCSFELRRVFLAIGDRLQACGALQERDDIFYLTYDEMHALGKGSLEARDAQARIVTRQKQLSEDSLIEAPDVISGDPQTIGERTPALTTPAREVREYLSGIGASAGSVQGRARIIQDPADAPRSLGHEDILVVPFSDIGWTPLFPGVGGVVVETGGQLSHAAIVAREYGLPAVLSVKSATRLIREGQKLTLDGRRGRVYLEPLPE